MPLITRLTSEKQVVVCVRRHRSRQAERVQHAGTQRPGEHAATCRRRAQGRAPRQPLGAVRGAPATRCRAWAYLANRRAGADGGRAAAQRRRRRAHDAGVHRSRESSHGAGTGSRFGQSFGIFRAVRWVTLRAHTAASAPKLQAGCAGVSGCGAGGSFAHTDDRSASGTLPQLAAWLADAVQRSGTSVVTPSGRAGLRPSA